MSRVGNLPLSDAQRAHMLAALGTVGKQAKAMSQLGYWSAEDNPTKLPRYAAMVEPLRRCYAGVARTNRLAQAIALMNRAKAVVQTGIEFNQLERGLDCVPDTMRGTSWDPASEPFRAGAVINTNAHGCYGWTTTGTATFATQAEAMAYAEELVKARGTRYVTVDRYTFPAEDDPMGWALVRKLWPPKPAPKAVTP